MVNRVFSLAVCVSMAVSTAALAQNQGKSFLFQFPGPEEPGARFLAYTADANPLIADIDALGPNNSRQILAKPDGSKFYIIGEGPIQRIDAALSNFQTVNGIVGAVRVAKLTPNGNLLIVAADQLYVVNTANDTIVATGAGVSGTITDFTISRDSKRAWVLVESGFNGSIITVDLEKSQRIGDPLNLPFRGRGIALSPLGTLYVTFSNQIRIYDPATLTSPANGLIDLLAVPGPLNFTPDGTAAYFINMEPLIGGRAILRLNTATNEITDWPAFNPGVQPPLFEQILIAGNQRIFAYSRAAKTLFDVTGVPLSAQQSALNSLFPANQVLGAAVSGELPSARFLFVLIDNGNQTNLLRVDLSNNTVNAQTLALINSGRFQFVGVPPIQGAAAFLQFNNNQTLQNGGLALPLITRVLDGLGRPVFNQLVTHTAPPESGVVLGTRDATTDSEGYVQTTATLPNTPGVYVITLTAGGATTSYTLVVPDQGGGNPGGPQLVSIVSGDGQLVESGVTTNLDHALTVKVVDANGSPRANVPLSWSLVDGTGNIIGADDTTDEQGIGRAYYNGNIPFGMPFRTSTIRTTAQSSGSVEFKIVNFNVDRSRGNEFGQPEIHVLTPVSLNVNIGQGDLLEGAIQATINSALFPAIGAPIPDVGIRIADRFDNRLPGPARCAGTSRSDNNGVASCNAIASCTLGRKPGLIVVGEYRQFDVIFNIGPGNATALQILTGNNQTGKQGDVLAPIAVTVTDGCGTPVPNVPLTWTVVQGSATLSQVQDVADVGGRASARVTLGGVPGPVQVRVTIANASPVVFNFTNNAVVSGIFLQSGGGQSVLASQAFPNPVVFIARDSNGAPLPGITMNFSVTGNAGINPSQGTTNASGTAQTNVVAGATPGSVTITATFGNFTAVANLQVRPPGPQVTSTSFFNAASFALGMVPCGLVTAIGNGIKPTPGVTSGISPFGPLPYTLDGVSITANGIPAPIQSVANANGQQQVTFQAPCELQPGTATVVVTVSGTSTTVTGVAVLAGQPGIFTYLGPNGRVYGAAIRAVDGSYVTPSNLARRGETYFLILTGLAQVTPATLTNAAGIANQNVNLTVVVGVNNAGVPVTSAQYLVGSIGVYLVGFQIPQNAATGTDQPLAVAVVINGQTVFGNSVFLPGVI